MSVRSKVFLVASIPLVVAVLGGAMFAWIQFERAQQFSSSHQDSNALWELAECYDGLLVATTVSRSLLNGGTYSDLSNWFNPQIQTAKKRNQTLREKAKPSSDASVRLHIINVTNSYDDLLNAIAVFDDSDIAKENLNQCTTKLVTTYRAFSDWSETEISFEDYRLALAENTIRQYHSRLSAALIIRTLPDEQHDPLHRIMTSSASPAAKGLETAHTILPNNKAIGQITEMIIGSKKKLVPTVSHRLFDYFTYSREPGWQEDAESISTITKKTYSNIQNDILNQLENDYYSARSKLWLIMLKIALLLVATGLLTFFTGLSIVKPLSTLAEAASDLAKGKIRLSEIPTKSKRKDEIGEVAQAFEDLQHNMDALSDELRDVQHAILNNSQLARTRSERFEGTWGEIADDMNLALEHVNTVNNEKLAAEHILHESQRRSLVGKMAGGMAHDFNNLLSVIVGFTEIARTSEKTDHSSLNEIDKAGQKAKDLVARIMAIGRKSELSMQNLNLHQLVSESESAIKAILPSNMNLTLDLVDDSMISADPTSFSQIILNLAVNARDAMKGNGGTLSIKCSEYFNHEIKETSVGDTIVPGKYWCLEIADQGCGIPEQSIRKVFEPFYTTKKVTEGTGLGLAMVHSLILQSGATLDLKSVENKGTTFYLNFPEVEAKVVNKKQSVPNESKPHSEGINILLVDDEISVRKFMKIALNKLGHHVSEAENGDQGYEMFKTQFHDSDTAIPDLIISDVMMPETTGPEMVRKIQAEFDTEIPTIFVSGYSADQLGREIDLTNAYRLKKPFTLDQLRMKIEQTDDDKKKLMEVALVA